MKKFLITTTCTVFATGAIAALANVDTDGDGVVSFTEMQTVVPSLTEETFAAVDANGDGVVDESELAAAEEVGLVPPTGG